MERPSRSKKTVNYSEFQDAEHDEDFACTMVPPSKKARVSVRDVGQDEKSASKSQSQEAVSQSAKQKARLAMDDKLYERQLEAALQLSLMQTAETVEELPSGDTYDKKPVPTEQENTVRPALLSNCSVDASLLGLDEISEEIVAHSAPSRQRQAASKAAEQQRRILNEEKDSSAENEEDEDYGSACSPESESEEDFSVNEESEDEEFTVKKNKNSKKKVSKKQAVSRPTSTGKGKNTPKTKSKAQGKKATSPKTTVEAGTPSACRTAASVRPAPLTKRMRPAPMSKAAVPVSPAGGGLPKRNAPGLVRRSPSVTQNATVKSPGQGLRLGLSRLARVKPLHPRVAH